MVAPSRRGRLAVAAAVAALATTASAQTFRRAAACPDLGCIYPPDQSTFIAGQAFDIRIEVHAPANGTAPFNNGVPSEDFALYIGGKGAELQEIASFYTIEDPVVERYNFTYAEDLWMQANGTETLVNVLAKSYRHLTLFNPGEYKLKLQYNSGMETLASWKVLPLAKERKAKNVILFVGDGMAPSMVSAARLLGHKTVNGQYKTRLAMDESEGFGMQMTHSLDSFITDSANSATALMAGHKSTVNALNAFTDSTGKPNGNPKFETIFEMARRLYNAKIGIVSTAFLADATPAAVVAHTSKRSEYDYVVDTFLDGGAVAYKGVPQNFSWTAWDGPDVLFGGGGKDFVPKASNGNVSKIDRWLERGYGWAHTNATLQSLDNSKRALGLFANENLPTWLDRNVFTDNLPDFPTWDAENKTFSAPTTDVPGLKEMTLKAIDILHTRSKADGTPFMMMSEAASIDKAMHAVDYPRALGDLLELDDTIRATLNRLEELGLREDTLVVVTADHAHGFDVYGSVDTEFLAAQPDNDKKRLAVGTYINSGLSGYQVEQGVNPQNQTAVVGPQGEGFPVTWEPRYTAAFGLAASVDQFEDFKTHPSTRATSLEKLSNGTYRANIEDSPNGFFVSGNLPGTADQGVHSLVDVQVFSWGPGHELFRGMMDSTNVAQRIAQAMDLGRDKKGDFAVGQRKGKKN
ncbi:hypothetical protein JCM10449v2_001935 [Rhodotorula kratochvilovae]